MCIDLVWKFEGKVNNFDFSEFLSVNDASFGHKDLFPYERQSNSHERYNKTEIDPMVQIITALGKNLHDG